MAKSVLRSLCFQKKIYNLRPEIRNVYCVSLIVWSSVPYS